MAKIAYCVVALLLITGCGALTPSAPAIAKFSVLFGSESSRKIIIFVHGYDSGPTSAWTNRSGVSWPELIKDDAKFHDYTVATYRYDTPVFHLTSTIEEIAVRMLRQIEDENIFEKYNEVYFIGHSMGGLVTKRVLVDLHRPTQIDKLRKVKAVLFIATPAQGSNIAELASYLSANPQIANMKPADLNAFLQGLEDQWQDLMRERSVPTFPRSFCAYETKPTYGTVTVSRVYAATYCDQNPFPVDENHADIVKPASRDSAIYDWARARILETSILAEGPRLKFSIWKAPYTYTSGLTVEGVEWKEQYREYDFTIKNMSKTEGITDLRLRYALPWAVMVSRSISQQGCEGLVIASNQLEPLKGGVKNHITSLHEYWTNVIEINATSLFPEAVVHGKLVMSVDMEPNKHSLLTVEYRDKSGVTKTSFAQRISVIDAESGSLKIEPEPLKGTFEMDMMSYFKEPIRFSEKNKSLVDK